MKAEEFRVGITLNRKHGKGWTYTAIDEDLMGQIFGDGLRYSINDFEPIPLTEEILLKAGFKYQDRDVNTKEPQRFYISPKFKRAEYWLDYNLPERGRSYCWLNWDTGAGRNFVSLPNSDSILYLHQLQNLWFTLTGEELEIEY